MSDQSTPWVVTEAAVRALKDASRAHGMWNVGVRVAAVGGASGGFDLSFAEDPERGDVVFSCHGLRFFMDEALAASARGTTVDIRGGQFVFRQPTR